MPHKQYLHRPTVMKDLTVILVVNVGFLFLFSQFDVLEWLYESSRHYEHYEIDEIFSVGITLSLSFLIFSYRRIVELGELARTLEQMSLLDPMTGLANRRAGQISLISWCELAEHKNEVFTVYQIDFDQFKTINDMYGQQVGDEALKLASRILNEFIPSSSLLCRWLDDNFLVVVLNTSVENPHEFAHKLQQAVSGKIMGKTLNITASVGYKVWQKGQVVEDILHEVDDALMHAKHSGNEQIKGN